MPRGKFQPTQNFLMVNNFTDTLPSVKLISIMSQKGPAATIKGMAGFEGVVFEASEEFQYPHGWKYRIRSSQLPTSAAEFPSSWEMQSQFQLRFAGPQVCDPSGLMLTPTWFRPGSGPDRQTPTVCLTQTVSKYGYGP
jgi:hypothetical protein